MGGSWGKRILAGWAALAILAPGGALAQLAPQGPWPSRPFAERPRNTPGNFDYYTMVLSWSPTHCSTTERGTDDNQCARTDGIRYGFVLHGLWPQYESGYPERCHTRWKPFVPDQVINDVSDVMPSRGLIIHEYREHGTCSGLRPQPYFALARELFRRINIPKRYRNPFETQVISPRDVMVDFLRANPELKPNMITITCGGPGNRLRDVRICMTKQGRPRPCGINEMKGNLCRASQMRVPPVRATAWDYEHDRLREPKRKGLAKPRIYEVPLKRQ
jgi:ribonuclease T2